LDNGCWSWTKDEFEELQTTPLSADEAFKMLLAGDITADDYHASVKER
jgi:hypothetical protein